MTEIGGSSERLPVSIPGRPAEPVVIAWAAVTDTGRRRAANEDSYVAVSPMFAVADGMGGHSAGDLASAAVVSRLADAITGDFAAPRAVERALEAATADISVISGDSELGVGTTVTGALLTLQDDEPYFAVFNVGDSRVYAFERNELVQITIDHSVVQELVESGSLTRAEAERHPDSNIITRAVGFNSAPMPDFWMIRAVAGLRLLLCSDGLTKEIDDESLRVHLEGSASAAEASDALIDAALAAGGRDNITVIVIDVLDAPAPVIDEDTAPRSQPR